MPKYYVVWGSGDIGENGVFETATHRQVVDCDHLRKRNLSSYQVAGWSDERIEKFAESIIRSRKAS